MTSVASSSLEQQHACLLLDLEGRICGWSSGAQTLFGRAAADALGRSVAWLFGAQVLGELGSACGGRELRAACSARKADGAELRLTLYISELVSEPGVQQRYVVVVHDVTQQRGAEA